MTPICALQVSPPPRGRGGQARVKGVGRRSGLYLVNPRIKSRIKSADGHDEKTERNAKPTANAISADKTLSEQQKSMVPCSHDELDRRRPRSCPEAWCSSRRLTTTISGMGPDRSDHHGGQSDDRIIAQRGHGFQGHVAGALDGPFVVLFEEYGSDESGDGFVVGENANDFGPSFDFAVEPLEAMGGMDLGPVIDGEAHLGEDVVLGLVHEEGELWQLGPELIGDLAPLRLGGLGAVLSKGGS